MKTPFGGRTVQIFIIFVSAIMALLQGDSANGLRLNSSRPAPARGCAIHNHVKDLPDCEDFPSDSPPARR